MANETQIQAARYCADFVRRADEHRWLATRFLAPPLRDKVIALYALHHEIRRVPAAVSEPPLGEIRLQWWREAVAEIAAGERRRAHPVVEYALETRCIAEGPARAAIDGAIDARAHLLYGDVFSSVDGLFDWLEVSEGWLAIARASLAPDRASRPDDLFARAEAAFAAAREVSVIAPDLFRREASEIQKRVSVASRAAVAALSDASGDRVALHLHLALTEKRLRKDGAFAPLAARWRLFSALAFGRF